MNTQEKLKSDLASGAVATRISTAEQLATMGEEAQFAAVELVVSCADADESVRNWSVAALEGLGTPSIESIGSLCELAKDSNPMVAYWAITLLGRIGAKASNCQDVLARVLTQTAEVSVQQRAVWAIGKMGSLQPTTIKSLAWASESNDPKVSGTAQRILQQTLSI
ncbi:hypothetical protein Q31b_02300 [Novipirellula aureliae]|uniref:HEAT repeat protein n=1 Tax=Novipirellula aureliae TaxID=2527966 RepID=A0A5C6ECX9_9BACT|nr:HEAT repeat domain-containing protein [Novipirellula aureliae]TWU45059.1 hypothetical protein Q31b_02300 [Novipirellula aureliae]